MKTPMKPYLFRVHRERVDGETVSVRLEPFAETDVLHPNEGDEFITGALACDPYAEAKKQP